MTSFEDFLELSYRGIYSKSTLPQERYRLKDRKWKVMSRVWVELPSYAIFI